MAEIAGSFLGPAIEAVKWVGAPIIRQFNYLCCFTSNITSLKHEAEKLDATTGDLQGQVDRARDNVRVIAREVETWLTTSKDIKDEMNGILNEVPNVESGCLKLRAHFSLSKRAKKTSDRMKELRGQCKFDAISQPRPPAAMGAAPLGRTHEFESRKQIEEDIMTTLRGGNVNMIGICGMGGLGKTTMAKRIMNRALKEQVFEEIVMAVVSQPVDTLRIHLEIGGSLGLDLKDETSLANRVQKLHARLSGTKRILLVLDDVWERLVLEDDLGIPCGCTILLTSRNSDVLRAMNVEKIFGMEILSEEEAWFLFRERVGTYVDDTELNSLAKQVVKECSGLPIALTTVGAALKDEKNVPIWKDAVRQLRQCDPDIPDFIAKVYNPLKLSYDVLDSKHAKSVFLLCCLFREDADICLEYLTCFCMGLGIFEGGIRNLEEARNRMCTLTKRLKSRSLLLDGRNEDCVRMHDVVRDVCIFIAKQEGYIGHNDCTWISFFQTFEERTKLPTNLRLLFLTRNSKLEEEIKFDNTFLERIRDLHVLSIQNYPFTSLPHTTQSLRNLNTLVLSSCYELETISVVGEFINLEILICRGCYRIKELPPEIKGLNRLKLLELTECRYLQRIGRGIISSLVGLEELKMRRSFKKWEASNREEKENAGLRELEALTNLRCLEIEIEDPALAAENMRLSSKLDRFHITTAAIPYFLEFNLHSSNKKMRLEWEGETCLGHWIEMQLLRGTECLFFSGNGANNLDLTKCQNIRWLKLGKCETMKNIVRTSIDDATVFSSIEYLEFYSLPKLEEILDGPITSNSFKNLKELKLEILPVLKQLWKCSSLRENNYDFPLFNNLSSIKISLCPRLRNLGQLSVAGKDCLSQLESLEIVGCEMMEQVFLWNEEDQNKDNRRHITKLKKVELNSIITKMFPKLKEVKLYNLPNLATFYQGIEGIEFPLLTGMCIEECPKMKSMVSIGMGSNENNSGGIDDHYSPLFCQPEKVSFSNLKKLQTDRNPFRGHKIHVSLFNGLEKLIISKYHGSITSSIAANLVSLKILTIQKCDEMVKVIKDEEEKAMSGGQRTLLFPNLQILRLIDLRNLVSFCEWKWEFELPSLRELTIYECPNMKNFTLGFLTAPNLEAFHTDLNNYLQVSFGSLKKLIIEVNDKPFYRYNIPVSLFNGLESLFVSRYKGSMSLFSSSIAGNLVNLTKLIICNCDEMVKVIEDEEEEENVVSAVQRTTLLFPKLQELDLYNLGKLVSFCEWNCDVELPSLRRVAIEGCHNMKDFTLGHLTTPNLKIVQIDYQDFRAAKDLNGVLQQKYLRRAKERHEEDQERKGEIEEEKPTS